MTVVRAKEPLEEKVTRFTEEHAIRPADRQEVKVQIQGTEGMTDEEEANSSSDENAIPPARSSDM